MNKTKFRSVKTAFGRTCRFSLMKMLISDFILFYYHYLFFIIDMFWMMSQTFEPYKIAEPFSFLGTFIQPLNHFWKSTDLSRLIASQNLICSKLINFY